MYDQAFPPKGDSLTDRLYLRVLRYVKQVSISRVRDTYHRFGLSERVLKYSAELLEEAGQSVLLVSCVA